MRENEVLFFLLIVVMMRSRKTGSTGTAVSLDFEISCKNLNQVILLHIMSINQIILFNFSFQASYLSSGFVYAKVANLILFFRADPRYGLVYLLLFTLQAILLPEPTYKGPEKITYFRFVQSFYITE